jgi:transcriptional regulator with XRE-family HTH domain
MQDVAQDLKTWRKLRGLTQAQVAERAGVSRPAVVRLESGDGNASLETVMRVMRALGTMDLLVAALDPYATDVGRLRSEERLPVRVRTQRLARDE